MYMCTMCIVVCEILYTLLHLIGRFLGIWSCVVSSSVLEIMFMVLHCECKS